MTPDFKSISPYELRVKLFEDSDIVSRIDKAKASVLSPKPSIRALAKNFYD